MLNFTFKKTETNQLETEIARLFEVMKNMSPIDDEYATVADQLSKLYKLKEIDSKKRVSPDAMVAAATNLAGMLLVINYERVHIITTKAFGLVSKSVK